MISAGTGILVLKVLVGYLLFSAGIGVYLRLRDACWIRREPFDAFLACLVGFIFGLAVGALVLFIVAAVCAAVFVLLL